MAIPQGPIILTGAASGVGDATARQLIERGHEVISVDIKQPTAAVAAHHQCDLSDPASIDATLSKLDGRYASLLNVAGVPNTVGDEKTVAVNTLGLRQITQGLWDRLADGGTIVNVASIAGNQWRKRREAIVELLATDSYAAGLDWWRANAETVGTDSYTFSKEAVVFYTMQLAVQGIARGIRVNDVGPGPVETPILPDFTEAVGAELMGKMIDMVGRPAQPGDIAEAIVVLAEGQMGWVNGQHIIVDGGLMAGFGSGTRRAT
ncbi:MAG: coniferyl-alcohol dehydrogenase [Alphaproteobacteria bacterium]